MPVRNCASPTEIGAGDIRTDNVREIAHKDITSAIILMGPDLRFGCDLPVRLKPISASPGETQPDPSGVCTDFGYDKIIFQFLTIAVVSLGERRPLGTKICSGAGWHSPKRFA